MIGGSPATYPQAVPSLTHRSGSLLRRGPSSLEDLRLDRWGRSGPRGAQPRLAQLAAERVKNLASRANCPHLEGCGLKAELRESRNSMRRYALEIQWVARPNVKLAVKYISLRQTIDAPVKFSFVIR